MLVEKTRKVSKIWLIVGDTSNVALATCLNLLNEHGTVFYGKNNPKRVFRIIPRKVKIRYTDLQKLANYYDFDYFLDRLIKDWLKI